jgi:ABC-2 type transport system ATP-binding protein
LIETVNLTKKFGDLTAVDGVTISVAEGEVFGFLGPNGAGKTTPLDFLPAKVRLNS